MKGSETIMSEKRSSFKILMDTTPKETTPDWNLIGPGVTELSISYNPQTNTEQFIHEDTATTELTGYQPNAPVTGQAVPGDAVYDFVNDIRKKLYIGSDAHTNVILWDVYDKPTGGSYPVTKQPVSIQIDSYGGAASDPLSIGYTINWRGSGVSGTFNPETKTFTEETASSASLD